MAKHILYNASVVANSVDLSDRATKVSFSVKTNGADAAAMSEIEDYKMPSTRAVSPISVEFFQDYASGKTYQTLMTLWTNRTTFNVVLKADSGSAASTNPQFTVPVYIDDMPVIDGSRGNGHMVSVTFQPAGLMTISAP